MKDMQHRLDSIQALRGIAVLLVLIFHIAGQQSAALGANPLHDGWVRSGPWNQGYAGVDLFFVISGFIMVYVTRNMESGLSSVGSFLYKRAARIYPLWWVFAGIMGLYYFAAHGMWGAPELKGLTPPAIGYFVKSLLLIPQDNLPVLGLGWSLIYEMQFYLIFAVFLCAPRRFLPAALGLWAVINIAGYAAGGTDMGPIGEVVFSPLSLEFIAGAAVGFLVLRRVDIAPKAVLIFGCVSTVLCVMAYTDKSNTLTSWGRVAVYTLPFAAMVYGAVTLEQKGQLSPSQWLVAIGNWSYSLYLSHYLVLIVIVRAGREAAPFLPDGLVNRFSLGAAGIWDNLAFTVIAIILSVLIAAISYNFIERPLLKTMRRRSGRDKQKDIL